MGNVIKIKRSNTSGAVPTLVDGEIAVNQKDKILFYVNENGALQRFDMASIQKELDDLKQKIRVSEFQDNISGGGTLSMYSYYIKWSYRFIAIPVGVTPTSIYGHFNIFMPPVGTVIKGLYGVADFTVTEDGIFLGPWQSLWCDAPTTQEVYNNYPGFSIMNYYGQGELPKNKIRVALNNADSDFIKFCNGKIVPYNSTKTALEP
jgi:hypothetical protein